MGYRVKPLQGVENELADDGEGTVRGWWSQLKQHSGNGEIIGLTDHWIQH